MIAVTAEDPWFEQNVDDILYQMLKRGPKSAQAWLKGMGSVEPVRPEPEEQELVAPPEQVRVGLAPVRSVWEADGVVWDDDYNLFKMSQ